MTHTLRRAAATLLLFWAVIALLVGSLGWMLILLTAAWLLGRQSRPAAPRHAAPEQVVARPVQAMSPQPQEPYWLMAAGTAAVLHSRDRDEPPAADDSAEDEECIEEMDDLPTGAAPAAAGWDTPDDAVANDDFGGYGGGGAWGGGGWGDGDDFGGFGGGGDWGDGDDW